MKTDVKINVHIISAVIQAVHNVINQFNIELLFQLRELYIKYSILLG